MPILTYVILKTLVILTEPLKHALVPDLWHLPLIRHCSSKKDSLQIVNNRTVIDFVEEVLFTVNCIALATSLFIRDVSLKTVHFP